MLELQQRHEEFPVEERQRLRLESDRLMEEACLAFNSAETDRLKVLKERNEKLFTVKSYTFFNVFLLWLFGCAGNGKERLGGGSAYRESYSLHRNLLLREFSVKPGQAYPPKVH